MAWIFLVPLSIIAYRRADQTGRPAYIWAVGAVVVGLAFGFGFAPLGDALIGDARLGVQAGIVIGGVAVAWLAGRDRPSSSNT